MLSRLALTLLSGLTILSAEPFRCSSFYGYVNGYPYSFGLGAMEPYLRRVGVTEQIGDVLVACSGGSAGVTHDVAVTVSLSVPVTSANPTGSKTDAILFLDEPARDAIAPGQNAFAGDLVAPTAGATAPYSIRFNGVRLTEAGSSAQIVRVVNIRANAAALPYGTGSIPPIFATVDTSPRLPGFPITGVVGYLNDRSGLSSVSEVSQTPGYQMEVRVREGAPPDFRTRTSPGQDQMPPGVPSQQESSFITSAFQAAGLGRTGLANSGTRILLRFSNVSAGQQVLVSTKPVSVGDYQSSDARLIATDDSGAGAYAEVPPTSVSPAPGIAPVPIVNGRGTAVYEIVVSDTGALEWMKFGVVLQGGTGTPTVEAMYGPLSTGAQTWIPRFAPPRAAPTIVPAAVFRDTSNQVRLLEYGNSQLYNAGGVFAGKPGAAQDSDGNTWIVTRDSYKGLYVTRFDAATKTFDQWTYVGGVTLSDPSVSISPDGAVYYTVRDEWNACSLGKFQRGVGGSWQNLGGIFSTDPQVSWNAFAYGLIAGRDTWGGIWTRSIPTTLSSTQFESPWTFRGGWVENQISLSEVVLAVRDPWNALWFARISPPSNFQWIPAQGIIDRGPQVAGPIAIGAARGGVWQRELGSAPEPLPWQDTHGVLVTEAPAWLNNELYIVGRDSGNSIWWYRSGSGQWANVGFAGVAASDISAVPR